MVGGQHPLDPEGSGQHGPLFSQGALSRGSNDTVTTGRTVKYEKQSWKDLEERKTNSEPGWIRVNKRVMPREQEQPETKSRETEGREK